MNLRPINKKESRMKKVIPISIGIFIIMIMVLSVLSLDKNKDDQLEYNGHKFTRVNSRWLTYIDNNRFEFAFPPKELEYINTDVAYGDLLYANKIYLSYNPEQPMLAPIRELMQNKNIIGLQQQLVIACPSDNEICKSGNLPIKDCSSADESTGIIVLELSNTTSIDFQNNCLTLSGTSETITKAIDKLTLKRLGIM